MARRRHLCGRSSGQSGAVLPMMLVFILVGTLLTTAGLVFAIASSRSGVTYERRDQSIAAERDALDYLVQTIRPDLARGVQGDAQAATVAGVYVSCTGQSGSGVASGAGRTDRTIDCSTPSLRATYRIFDRSGAQPGMIVETLSFTTLN